MAASSTSSLLRRTTDRHPMSLDIGPLQMAKAKVKPVDIDWKQAIGRAIERAVASAGLTKSEDAGQADVDEAEFSRWLTGVRRPQFDRLFAIEALRVHLVVALATLDPDAFAIKTTIEARRSA